MRLGEIKEIEISDFFNLVQEEGGTYEVETPEGWITLGNLVKKKKECYLLRLNDGTSLGASHDHYVETQNGWEKIESLDINQTIINTISGKREVVAREYIGTRNTFDFEVLHDKHSYYANGIVSHNTGKTLTCKWLREECIKHNLLYKVVTMEDYRGAGARSNIRSLFKLPAKKSGIIFFDDMDAMVQNRKVAGNSGELSTFLSELDGLETVDGVVFIFTTNYIKELDAAFVRPGRIDLWLQFSEPTEALRRKFIVQKFQPELLVNDITIEELITKTNEYSYAEIEEIRKLFCFDLINGKSLSLESTFAVFDKHRKDFADRAAVRGFSQLEEPKEDYDDFVLPSYLA